MFETIKSTLVILCTRILVVFLTFYFLARILLRIRNFKYIFINFRAFGHSISDSNAFLSTFPESGLCISFGNSLERNPFAPLVFETKNLIQFILPRPKWMGKTNLRKILGPFFVQSLMFLQKTGCVSNSTSIYSENQQVVFDCLKQMASNQLKLPSKTVQKTLSYIQSVDMNAREHSKTIGTWAQIYDPKIIGNTRQENLTDKLFLWRIEMKGVDTKKLVTLILRTGRSPHHGPGLSHYMPAIEFLLERGYSIIPLGDISEFEQSKVFQRAGIILPRNIDVQRRSIDFSSIFYSKFTLGDMSGLWSIFTMRGNRGLCLNTTPAKFLMNRVEVLPRLWENKQGVRMNISQLFGTFGETVRGFNREIEIDGYKPIFHDPATILDCVRRFESEISEGTPLKIREPFLKYFEEYPPEMLTNCSVAPEILNLIN